METNSSSSETSFNSNFSPISYQNASRSVDMKNSDSDHEEIPITKEMIKVLLSSHYFIKYQATGSRSVKRVFFNPSLQKLTLEKDKMNSKFIFTTDIVGFESGFSDQLASILMQNAYNHKVYGLRLITKKRVIEMSSSSEEERRL